MCARLPVQRGACSLGAELRSLGLAYRDALQAEHAAQQTAQSASLAVNATTYILRVAVRSARESAAG